MLTGETKRYNTGIPRWSYLNLQFETTEVKSASRDHHHLCLDARLRPTCALWRRRIG
ncbi:MAG: hypothetical protein QOJ42_2516 [Acidobacteriaceae bacterium]|nr:hypothetical protein [Acidobacteriaceae bacterium]